MNVPMATTVTASAARRWRMIICMFTFPNERPTDERPPSLVCFDFTRTTHFRCPIALYSHLLHVQAADGRVSERYGHFHRGEIFLSHFSPNNNNRICYRKKCYKFNLLLFVLFLFDVFNFCSASLRLLRFKSNFLHAALRARKLAPITKLRLPAWGTVQNYRSLLFVHPKPLGPYPHFHSRK